MQSRFRLDPKSIPLSHLEEVFFNIDSNVQAAKLSKKESALYTSTQKAIKCFYCGKLGHKKSDCRAWKAAQEKSKNGNGNGGKKKDLSNVTCYKCKQKGHYANNCPNGKKQVTFEDSTKTRNKIQMHSDGIMSLNGRNSPSSSSTILCSSFTSWGNALIMSSDHWPCHSSPKFPSP